jgi:anti-anti-sigma regulatory factor
VTVDCTVRQQDIGMVARLAGRLDRSGVAQVRLHLLKCLAEQPDVLLVDLAGLTVADAMALPVFTAVARQAARWPGTPVLLCAPSPDTARLLSAAAYRRLPVFDSLESARDHVGNGGHGLPSIAEDLLPVTGAARQGRNVATDACLRWDLPDLVAPASLICSELISNAADHARTMMRLQLSLGTVYLFIAVRDGSPVEPVATVPVASARRGRGLYIVNVTAHSWGCLPAVDGKVVWASLVLNPR